MFGRLVSFFQRDIWRIELKRLPRPKRLAVAALRVFTLSFQDFVRDKCSLRASALTFFSLLSVVPTAAVAFGIAQGFGVDKGLEALLYEQLSGQEEAAQRIVEFSRRLLENTRGGVVAGVGVLLLLWSVLKLLNNIEQAFNEIWRVPLGRSLGRRFADYAAIMFVCPILLLVASSATVLISSGVQSMVERVEFLSRIGPAVLMLLKLLPFVTVWVLFTFVYLIVPNTKVRFAAALGGGIIGGSAYQLLQALLLNAQLGVSQYNAIYGSFAALPFFLFWLQLSWMIVLFGAEFAYACQHASTLEFEPDCRAASLRVRCLTALRIVRCCIESFSKAAPPLTAAQIAQAAGAPPCMTTDLIRRLVNAAVLSEVKLGSQTGYQPACASERLTIYAVIEALVRNGSDDFPKLQSSEFTELSAALDSFGEELRGCAANRPL